ncbi:hypothetical protein BT63DRAFT_436388 [Microthyrium microscopicum]|uniref:DUF3604 domain-containing protein n=1 Tax=Microthyrium microscopicum TaxID=703497 RepID=A0A6A6UTC5_9PEZI|nr:hypothetical protein BT63DRAFT_436388 [Microthyrium microscopicum]
MRLLSSTERSNLAGNYFAPEGLYEHIKGLPFLGTLACETKILTAGQWTEIIITYTVGGSGLADGAWIKGTFKFYSDWALFQTSDPASDNYVSAEYEANTLLPGQTPATVQGLAVRFDQKGHERPYQKAIIIDIVDGYLNPGDKIIVRLGDRRHGARGTRVQTFVEEDFRMRWYIDPVGTSRFAPIKPDLIFNIQSGAISKLKVISPRLVRPDTDFPLHVHTEDVWGNATTNQEDLQAHIRVVHKESEQRVVDSTISLNSDGWTYGSLKLFLKRQGQHLISVSVIDLSGNTIIARDEFISVKADLVVPRLLYADLHVHSDDTVGTNSTTYNFSYAQKIAGMDIVGYTANDFNITKERWEQTVEIIKRTNQPGELVIFPGTEWCGNSAAGGDHNVVFLDDLETSKIEFPIDRNGNVARSFEWNEDGPAELLPGAWPLDEVYATYAHAPSSHLMIPHVGGRRCNLSWHHPQLERLLEIGSAWGHFEWLLKDAVSRGWKMGVCANSDEHRGRCGGGVPGTAVFGTKGGLTGVLAPSLNRKSVAEALRSRRTFATTGERLAGLLYTDDGAVQGDDIRLKVGQSVKLNYLVCGGSGFSSVEAWDGNGIMWQRDLIAETETSSQVKKLIVTWGGARLLDRYREAVWDGIISIEGDGCTIKDVQPFGGVVDVPEEKVALQSDTRIVFQTRTSGDFDGALISFDDSQKLPAKILIEGRLSGYVKVGDALKPNSHKAEPIFVLEATIDELQSHGGKTIELAGGADLHVNAKLSSVNDLPTEVQGHFSAAVLEGKKARSVYMVAREWDGGKVITSPVFLEV